MKKLILASLLSVGIAYALDLDKVKCESKACEAYKKQLEKTAKSFHIFYKDIITLCKYSNDLTLKEAKLFGQDACDSTTIDEETIMKRMFPNL